MADRLLQCNSAPDRAVSHRRPAILPSQERPGGPRQWHRRGGNMVPQLLTRAGLRRGVSTAALAAALIVAMSAHAFECQSSDGEFKGSWDTSISYGQAWRLKDPNLALIGIADGGRAQSPNFDDGDL